MVAYVTQGSLNPFYGLLGNSKSYRFSNDLDSIKAARQGFPKRVLLSLAKRISLTITELCAILHISERTLQRYDDDTVIKTEYAEKAIELARL